MGPRPWRPKDELDGALERGDLPFAITVAKELALERHPVDVPTALRFLPLVAQQRPQEYESWALRWLARWLQESVEPTTARAAEVSACLADIPLEPEQAMSALREVAR
jgi:hypothetical protein